jgi:hypothetical protein
MPWNSNIVAATGLSFRTIFFPLCVRLCLNLLGLVVFWENSKRKQQTSHPKCSNALRPLKIIWKHGFRSLEHTMLTSEGVCMLNSIVVTDRTESTYLTLWLYQQHKLTVVEDSKKMGHWNKLHDTEVPWASGYMDQPVMKRNITTFK